MNEAGTLDVSADGWLRVGNSAPRACALGRAGVTADKREGDGATPLGAWPLRRVFYRPDRLPTPPDVGRSRLPVDPLTSGMGWCDDPTHADYNRLIALPHPAGHETLWRDDGLYDVIVVLGHNDDPPVPGQGSAIFLHCARPDPAGPHGFSPTAGCVALPRPDLLDLLAGLAPPPVLLRVSVGDQGAP
ncbi:L,D-transpeptidase family protein [Roseospira navarrensis]|uniref:L,D-transpeptidase family protein n=1 Tax=Roseospira navarrensis TaxID=140058 RepID=A0A7X1ZBL0_9PROT|nr:L,D-transpeptidase family protein [Roseospira navarrensis]MQX35343.1 L,D-transpeptidase family protein [Roseospira navarrensis]